MRNPLSTLRVPTNEERQEVSRRRYPPDSDTNYEEDLPVWVKPEALCYKVQLPNDPVLVHFGREPNCLPEIFAHLFPELCKSQAHVCETVKAVVQNKKKCF